MSLAATWSIHPCIFQTNKNKKYKTIAKFIKPKENMEQELVRLVK